MDTKHPDEGTLYAYVEGQLPVDGHSRVDAHLSACAECAAMVAEARGLIAAASGIIGALDDVPVNVVPRRRARRLPPWIAAAAVLVLAAGVSTVVIREGVDSHPDALSGTSDTREARLQSDVQAPASAISDIVSTERVVVGEGAVEEGAVERRASAAGKTERSVARATAAREPQEVRRQTEDRREEALAFTVGRERRGAASAAVPTTTPTSAPASTTAPAAARDLSSGQQVATITGRVITEEGQPLRSANVFIDELNISVATDTSGIYSLTVPSSRLQGQAAMVRARAIGYAPQSQRIAMAPGTQTADFELRQEVTQLSEVVTTSSTTADASRASAPLRTIRYEVSAGTIIELREFHAVVRIPPAGPEVSEYRWSDSAGTRRYVLSGRMSVAELERLARRLGELRVVR